MPSYDVGISLPSHPGLLEVPETDFNPTISFTSTPGFTEKQLPGVLLEVKARLIGQTLMPDKRAIGLEVFTTLFS